MAQVNIYTDGSALGNPGPGGYGIIMEFEKEFDIQIPDDQAENIATVGQAIQYIEQAS